MFQKALLGLWATCVFMMPTDARAAADGIVLYVNDSSSAHGNWTRRLDSTAAAGLYFDSVDDGRSNTGAALALPADYVEFTFNAPAATPYRVWIRMRAAGNSKDNDSVFAQFSDAVSSTGGAQFRIGTASGLSVELAGDAAGHNLSGWGWQTGMNKLSQPATIVFARSGKHKLRIQIREDGVSFDQIVLSPMSVTKAPGLIANDTTIVPQRTLAAVSAPSRPAPAHATIGIGQRPTLTWSAPGATRYDVRFGVTNPPPAAATGLKSARFAPAALADGTTYYWQVIARNGAEATTGPVWSFATATNELSPASDVVLHSADASSLHGNWAPVPDKTAAGGRALARTARGSSNAGAAATSAADYVEFTFNAPAATPYRMWVRTRAGADYNNAIVARFSDAVSSSGGPQFKIGTATGAGANAAGTGAAGSSSGWGWQEATNTVSQPTAIMFAASGTHKLRIETPEDSVSFDQIVLRPITSVTKAPGLIANDTTIVPQWTAVPTPWVSQDIGPTGLVGSTGYGNGVFLVSGAGADIWGVADAFQFVSMPVQGNAQIVARVSALSGANPYAKAGVMFRDALSAGAAHVLLDVRPNGSIEFMSRAATGATTSFVAGATQTAPVWLRLTRSGSTFKGEVSPDGSSWIVVGSTNVALAASASAGLAVTSHDAAELAIGTFDNVAVTLAAPSAPGGTSYDVRFGTTNPPPIVATGLMSADQFAPGTLANSTTYFWQVIARNASGTTTGPVWSFTTSANGSSSSPGNIVLHSADASNLHGNWARVYDATAAGSQAITSADRGWSTTAPQAAPADYFDFTFQAEAATTYRLWVRMRAGGNSMSNDSVFLQFSDAVALSGGAAFAIGTTEGISVTLATDTSGSGLNGWGWRTGVPPTVRFTTGGSHTLRLQTREDGVSIDQVVLSPADYVTTAPGAVSGDTTIVPRPQLPGSGAPVAYNAITDRNPYAEPPLPSLGSAGFAFIDPTFGSRMLRVTDSSTRPGSLNRSYRVPSNAHVAAWNSTSTLFYVVSNDGTVIPYAFDAATMTASRMQAAGTGNGGLTLGFNVEPQFSLVNPNVIYGVVSGGNNRTISQYDFQTGVYSPLLNLDSVVGGLAGTYVGGIMTGGTPAENLLTFFGGGGQDSHYYALWAPIGNLGARKLLNTLTSTINGVSTNTPLNFHLHAMEIDRSGRFVFLYPTGPELGSPRYASQVYVWDTLSDAVTPLTSGGPDGAAVMHPAGHATAGYGVWINQDCCTSSTWDAAQWQIRELTALAETRDLISPVQAVKEVYLADHTSWNNAQPSIRVPVISSTYRYGNNPAPWRAWDDEIIGIETASGGGNVWRFAHHRSNVAADNNPAGLYFWYQPIANVSPDGKWILFTSNWEKTLGTDAAEGTARQDVFLVQLTPAP
jgi:regulation of enolase protein 1 (concanavalin A-like superfamily)